MRRIYRCWYMRSNIRGIKGLAARRYAKSRENGVSATSSLSEGDANRCLIRVSYQPNHIGAGCPAYPGPVTQVSTQILTRSSGHVSSVPADIRELNTG